MAEFQEDVSFASHLVGISFLVNPNLLHEIQYISHWLCPHVSSVSYALG